MPDYTRIPESDGVRRRSPPTDAATPADEYTESETRPQIDAQRPTPPPRPDHPSTRTEFAQRSPQMTIITGA